MSTRGCVAVKTEKGWEGVYNHFDSYPTGLGTELYDYLKERIKDTEEMQKFKKELLHSGDWRNYLSGCKCQYCGKEHVGQAHSISGVICIELTDLKKKKQKSKVELEILQNVEKTGYPDPEVKYHNHSDLDETMTQKTVDPMFIEWVYVVDAENKKIEVLASHKSRKVGFILSKVGDIDFTKDEKPDFEKLEDGKYLLGK